MDMEESL